MLVVGGIVLVTWFVAPASSEAPRQPATPAQTTADIATATLADLNTELSRLSERLQAGDPYRMPARDPFRFGGGAARVGLAVPISVPVIAPEPPFHLPALVAILASDEDASFRAVLSAETADGADVLIVTSGETVAGLRVDDIRGDAVVLSDAASGRSYTLTLR